ncbi:MAG: type II 3-dehydroquinate dehydratase [Oligoflexales bacterium]|nr:type II 3-dehydroquinate dehydratase [Oligoflexales bacterium]
MAAPKNKKEKKILKILIASGVNLDRIGLRPSEHYGKIILEDIHNSLETYAKNWAKEMGVKVDLECYQSNNEAKFLEKITEKEWSGVVINPAAWGHTSLALADRLESIKAPIVEVHLSNLAKREQFRQHTYCSRVVSGVISGFGADSYILGLQAIFQKIKVSF